MALEIERKFLVTGMFQPHVVGSTKITQSYISTDPERTVRVCIESTKGFLTIKGSPNQTGVSRFEWENEIPINEAEDLLKICEPGTIQKTRFIVPEKTGLNFEVDVFHGDNEGLIIAEIELPTEGYQFVKPSWLGEEVTGDTRYYNSMLVKNPIKNSNNQT